MWPMEYLSSQCPTYYQRNYYYFYYEAQRSHFVVISVKIKERIKIFPIPWCSFTLFKNNVNFDQILRQPKKFLRKPKSRNKKEITTMAFIFRLP